MSRNIMFHSVGCENFNFWTRKHLSVGLDNFKRFCQFLVKNGYKSVQLDEWYDIQNQPNRKNEKEILLTFDDGYLDNWVYVFPILKFYNLKGTLFINPDFIDIENINIRPQYSEKGFDPENVKQILGFLNWEEIKLMDKSGIIDVQSHSMTHNQYFYSDKIIDTYRQQEKYDWIAWNFRPDRKPYYITEDLSTFVPYGYPIFEHGRALSLRKYIPDQKLIDFAITLDKKLNKEELIKRITKKKEEYPGRFESEAEMEKRYSFELNESKKILEEKLNKSIKYLCWPGGGYNNLSVNKSIEAGYKMSTVSSRDTREYDNFNTEYKRLHRIGLGDKFFVNGTWVQSRNKNILKDAFYAKNNLFFAKMKLKMEHLIIKLTN